MKCVYCAREETEVQREPPGQEETEASPRSRPPSCELQAPGTLCTDPLTLLHSQESRVISKHISKAATGSASMSMVLHEGKQGFAFLDWVDWFAPIIRAEPFSHGPGPLPPPPQASTCLLSPSFG